MWKKTSYCPMCQQYVHPVKKEFSWTLFLVLLGVFYLFYRLLFCPEKCCPICGYDRLLRHEPAAPPSKPIV